MKKITMVEAVFYKLYMSFKDEKTRERYIPVHEFMGEIFIKELNKWGYVSYECSARLSEMYRDNPGLLQREYITGKSGARFYGYRIKYGVTPETLKDEKLREFRARLFPRMMVSSMTKVDAEKIAKEMRVGGVIRIANDQAIQEV